MKLSSDPSSSRAPIYRKYFDGVSAASARRVLLFFALGLLLVEGLARLEPAHHWRTPINSMHGIRWLFQEVTMEEGPKVIALGDSALLGGGVHDHDKTFMGQLAIAEAGHEQVFNLGMPSGENATSLLLVDALRSQHVTGINRVVIQVLPGKFFALASGAGWEPNAVDELQRFVPFVQPARHGIATRPVTTPDRVEALLQYDLGRVSAAYRDRDYLRIEEVGGYPSFWAVGRMLPQRIRAAVLSQKGRGTNRLGARLEDGPFTLSQREPGSSAEFAERPQGTYLLAAIEAATRLSGKAPILLEYPVHYEFNELSRAALRETLATLDKIDRFLERIAASTGSPLLRVDSRTFQAPYLWTRTSAHPSAAGQLEIWRRLGPALVGELG